MDQDSQAPAGFCPRCEYPTNPGICPECGFAVTAENLAGSPVSVRRKRIRRRLIIVLPLLVLAAVGVFLYRSLNWIAIAPSSVLFAFQGEYDQPVAQELFRRFRLGSLSQKQTQELFDAYVDDPLIAGYVKFPPDIPFKLPIQSRARLPSSSWVAMLENWHMAVDGEQIESWVKRPFESEEKDAVGRQWIWCPPLSKGRHHITINGIATLKVKMPDGVSSELHRRRVQLSRDVEISGELWDYVQADVSPELSGRLKESIAAVAFIDPAFNEKAVLAILYGQPEVSIAGMVLVRANGAGEGFIPLREVLLKGGGAQLIYLDSTLRLDRSGSLDVMINPDPLVALHSSGRRYLGGVVQWQHLPIRTDVQVSIPFALNQASVLPTSIVLHQLSEEE